MVPSRGAARPTVRALPRHSGRRTLRGNASVNPPYAPARSAEAAIGAPSALDFARRSIYNLVMKRDIKTRALVDRIASDCISVRVRLMNRVVTAVYDEALRPQGVRVSQMNILVAVARVGEVRPADVCRLLRIEKSTLSRDVELMKTNGWLASDPPDGGRNQVLRVTAEGLDLLVRCRPAWESAQAEASELIGAAGVDALRQIAARLGLTTTAG